MLTYSELFEFCLVVIGIIGLCFQEKKEVTASRFPKQAVTL